LLQPAPAACAFGRGGRYLRFLADGLTFIPITGVPIRWASDQPSSTETVEEKKVFPYGFL
jgi:hypothetical protein